MSPIRTVKCTHILVQVNVGFYDEEGNLLGEETFPQADGNTTIARLYHPYAEYLPVLIDTCLEQARAKLRLREQAMSPAEPGLEEREPSGG